MSRFKLIQLVAHTAFFLLGVGVAPLANAQSYTFTDLGTLGGAGSSATAINNSGQVVGHADTPDGTGYHAVLWSGGTATDLGTLGGAYSGATAINDVGQVAGYANINMGNSTTHATLWNGTAATDLGTLGGTGSIATGVNNAGQVAGYALTNGNAAYHATLWNNTVATDLGNMGRSESFAGGINNAGQVAGYTTMAYASGHAALWTSSTASDLSTQVGLYHGSWSLAAAINNDGLIVGSAQTTLISDYYHAILYKGNRFTDLGTLGGVSSGANALNNVGQVVGYFYTSQNIGISPHAVLWNGTTAIDLNSFLDASAVSAGWVLNQANGINDNGWIVGDATNTLTGQSHAFELAPVPEPETYAMILAGLGLLGFIRRRKKLAPLGIAISLLAAIGATDASASLEQQSVTGPTSIITAVWDTDTSLQWLSPTATQGLSLPSVLAGAGGWLSSGFRYASSNELAGLILHAGVPADIGALANSASGGESWSSAGDVQKMQSLVTILGWTYQNNPPTPGSPFGQRTVYGVLSDIFRGDGQSPPSHYYASISVSDSVAHAYLGEQWLYSSQDSAVGSFLVRNVSIASPIPEPETYAMLLAGLGLLGFAARRKTI